MAEPTGRHDWHIGVGSPLNTPTYSARVDEICGTNGAGIPATLGKVSIAWNPRKVLRVMFGGKAEAAYGACQGWALGQESLKEAVSAACEWALAYHGRDMRHGQSVSTKPGNYVRESLSNDLRHATRKAGLDLWKRESDGKREWVRAYRVGLVTPAEDEDGNESETTELDDPALREPQEDQDDGYYRARRERHRQQLNSFLTYWALSDPLGAEAFRAAHMHERTLEHVAGDYGVNRSTAKRRADKVYKEVHSDFSSHGRQVWHREDVPKRRRPGDTGSGRGGIWYGSADPPSVLAGIEPKYIQRNPTPWQRWTLTPFGWLDVGKTSPSCVNA